MKLKVYGMQQRMLDQISHLGMVGLMILGARFLRIPHFMMKLKNDFSFPLPKKIWCSGMMNQKTLMGSPAARLKDPKSFFEHID